MKSLQSEKKSSKLAKLNSHRANDARNSLNQGHSVPMGTAINSEERAANRPKRVPLHEQRQQRLKAPERTGFKRHWFNDIHDRLQSAYLAGWEHVVNSNIQVGEGSSKDEKNLGATVSRDVGGIRAYLMEIPIELWQEDQMAKIAARKLNRNNVTKIKKSEGQYSPTHSEHSVEVTRSN